MATTTLSITEFNITVERAAKINARAAKRGFTGRFVVEGSNRRQVEVKTDIYGNALAFPRYVEVIDCTLTGDPAKFEGWTFLARVDVEGDTFTLATGPGVEQIDRSLVRVGECDHCHQTRGRKNTYLVQGEDGQVLNVGSSCIKDFLGHTVAFAFIGEKDVEDEIWADFGGTHSTNYNKVNDVLALAIASIRQHGFAATSGYGVSTKARVLNVIGDYRLTDVEQAAADALAAAAKNVPAEDVAKVIEFINSEDFKGSNYCDNLKAIASQEFVTHNNVGLLVSAPQALARHLGQIAERAVKVASEWIGTQGAKVTTTITLTRVQAIEGEYNGYSSTSLLIIGHTDAGEVVKTFTTAAWAWDDEIKPGAVVTITGTIKALEDYQGTKQTALTRTKKIA